MLSFIFLKDISFDFASARYLIKLAINMIGILNLAKAECAHYHHHTKESCADFDGASCLTQQ